MITDFIFSVPAYLLVALISVLPDGQSSPPAFVEGVHTIWGYIQAVSFIVPAEAMVFCLAIAIPYHIAIFGFWGVNWLLKKIPGIN